MQMVWTTEKETLFIVKNAGLFGTKAGGVYQASQYMACAAAAASHLHVAFTSTGMMCTLF